jgi:hypothetical protein
MVFHLQNAPIGRALLYGSSSTGLIVRQCLGHRELVAVTQTVLMTAFAWAATARWTCGERSVPTEREIGRRL